MSDQQYYRILLDDYSAASFTSFDKAYFGTMSDLEGWIKAIEVEKCFAERFSSLTKTFRAYQSGQHNITHNVAYQEVRFLDKVTLLYRESYTAEKLAWEHLNTWQWPYFMSCERWNPNTSGYDVKTDTTDASWPSSTVSSMAQIQTSKHRQAVCCGVP